MTIPIHPAGISISLCRNRSLQTSTYLAKTHDAIKMDILAELSLVDFVLFFSFRIPQHHQLYMCIDEICCLCLMVSIVGCQRSECICMPDAIGQNVYVCSMVSKWLDMLKGVSTSWPFWLIRSSLYFREKPKGWSLSADDGGFPSSAAEHGGGITRSRLLS